MTATPDHLRRRITLLVCCSALFLSTLDSTALAVALPQLQADLGLSIASLQWVVATNPLMRSGILFLTGHLGDRFGPLRIFRIGTIVFLLGSACCALAPGAGTLIAARAIQGAGGALMTPPSIALLAGIFTSREERNRALGSWSASAGVATAIGPVVGGVLVEYAGWRSVFLVSIPFALLVLFGTTIALESPAERSRHSKIDIPGHLLIGASMLAATFGLSAVSSGGWLQPTVLIALSASAVALVAWIVAERRAAEPVVDPAVFTRPQLGAGVLTAGFAYFCLTGFTFVNTLFLQQILGLTPLHAGLLTLPLTLLTLIGAKVSGRWAGSVGSRRPILVAFILLGLSMAYFAGAMDPGIPAPLLMIGYLLLGAGMGLANPAATSLAVSSLPVSQAGVASAITSTARQIGMNLGVAVIGAVAASFSASASDDGFATGIRVACGATAVLALAGLAAINRLLPQNSASTGAIDSDPAQRPSHSEGDAMHT